MNDWLYRISPCLRIAGNAPTQSGWVEAMRYIYEHELVLFEHSDYAVEIETEKIECPAGSYIIVPPGRRHISRETAGRPGHRYWVHFDWLFSGDSAHLPVMTYCPARPQEHLFRPAPDLVPSQILHGTVRNLNTTLELFRRIENLFNFGSGQEKMVSRGIFLELLLDLLCPENETRTPEDAAVRLASKIRRQLSRFADRQVSATGSIQDFLQESGISYAHQCRIFKQCYGISPLQYVTELRMTRVKNLLRDTSCSVSEIAGMVGFDNLGYFSRVFRKSTGLTPREYRNH
ncbi:MAG: helix-turn-helix transcriptional regulator [Victivallaceae bacterium]|jgi:AraC-like DNA-binding protein